MVQVSVHNVKTGRQATGEGEDWTSATTAALKRAGERGRFHLSRPEIVGSNCKRCSVLREAPTSGRNGNGYAASVGDTYTVSTLA